MNILYFYQKNERKIQITIYKDMSQSFKQEENYRGKFYLFKWRKTASCKSILVFFILHEMEKYKWELSYLGSPNRPKLLWNGSIGEK